MAASAPQGPAAPLDSDPNMAEALRWARRQQAITEALQAAALYDEAGEPAYAAGCRAEAARMRQAINS